MTTPPETHPVTVAGLRRDLPLLEVAPGVRIAVFNMLGDTEVVEACARELAARLPKEVDVIATAEAKSIPLAHAMSVASGLPYVVLRKSWKAYMRDAPTSRTLSITTGREQTLYLDRKDVDLLAGREVALVDDVVSTGSTLRAMRELVEQAGGKVAAVAAVFTEGDERPDVIALGHLPLFDSA